MVLSKEKQFSVALSSAGIDTNRLLHSFCHLILECVIHLWTAQDACLNP